MLHGILVGASEWALFTRSIPRFEILVNCGRI